MASFRLILFYFFCFFFMMFYKLGDCYEVNKYATYVVGREMMLKYLKEYKEKPFVLYFYYSKRCPHCLKVKNFMLQNEKFVLKDAKEGETATYDGDETANKITVIMKSVYADSKPKRRNSFYDELLRKGHRAQVPAVEFNNLMMYESLEILEMLKELAEYVSSVREKSSTDSLDVKDGEKHEKSISRGSKRKGAEDLSNRDAFGEINTNVDQHKEK